MEEKLISPGVEPIVIVHKPLFSPIAYIAKEKTTVTS
jgi:hypothetical protein